MRPESYSISIWADRSDIEVNTNGAITLYAETDFNAEKVLKREWYFQKLVVSLEGMERLLMKCLRRSQRGLLVL